MNDYQRGLLRAAQILAQMAESCGGAERCAYLDAVAALRAEAERVDVGGVEVLSAVFDGNTTEQHDAKVIFAAMSTALLKQVEEEVKCL